MEAHTPDLHTANLPRVFWIYLIGAALVAAGFPDFSMMSFHFEKANTVSDTWIPIFYALAMGTSGLGSLVFGKLFDQKGLGILIPLTLITVPFVPLVFLGGYYAVLVGCALWGMGMGVHESIVAAAVSKMVPLQRRAFGLWHFQHRSRNLLVSRKRREQSRSLMSLRWYESPTSAARIAALSADQAPTAIIGCPHMTEFSQPLAHDLAEAAH